MEGSGSGATCLYAILGVDPSASEADIKKAYRARALQLHPDKHGDKSPAQLEVVNQRFVEVQEAWAVLSNPQEKAWYDEHREDILRGASAAGEGGADEAAASMPNLWRYFSPACHAGFDPAVPNNFFEVFQRVFEEIWACEPDSRRSELTLPSFGGPEASWKALKSFYSFWSNFTSQSPFAWADKWRVPDGETRDIRRQMKKENDRERAVEKKKWVECVRRLAGHVKAMDRRVIKHQQLQKEDAEVKKQEQKESQRLKREEKLKEREQRAQEAEEISEDEETKQMEEEYWRKKEADVEILEEAESNDLYCAVCEKEFRSDGQMQNHLASRKHRDLVARLRQELAMAGEEVPEEVVQLEASAAKSQSQAAPSQGSSSKKKKKKKKQQQQQKQQQEEEGDGDEEEAGDGSEAGDPNEDEDEADPQVLMEAVKDWLDDPSNDVDSKVADGKKKARRAKKGKAGKGPMSVEGGTAVAVESKCVQCGEMFASRSALFRHLEATGHAQPLETSTSKKKTKGKKK